jgi:hypothetical protein
MPMDDEEPVADGLLAVARAIRDLGTGNAATEMGGMEAHAVLLKESLEGMCAALSEIARSINHLADVLDR